MRAADKPALANALKTNNNPGYFQIDDQESVCHVIDGGMLLQWLPWENGKTYSEICDMYVSFVNSKFKTPTVVFDGYEGGPNTKDNTHARRSTGIVGMEVRFNAATKFHGKKKLFLSNYKNKTEFIKMLSCALNEDGIQTSQATNDADVLIVLTAVRLSLSSYTILVGDDTDLLVLLCYHASMDSRPIYFQPRPKPHRGIVSWDIHKLKTDLGEDVCQHILFIHAFLGCDTTSKLFGIGKGLGIRYFEKNEVFRNAAKLYNMPPEMVSKEDIIQAGEEALVCLYKGKPGQTLNDVRVQSFTEKVAKASIFVDPKALPPTSDAATFHSLRVYLQVQDWKGETLMNPLEYRWELTDDRLYPVASTRPPAPSHIMKVVRCSCQSGCRTLACSCRKVGLECSSACSACKGLSCDNSIMPEFSTE